MNERNAAPESSSTSRPPIPPRISGSPSSSRPLHSNSSVHRSRYTSGSTHGEMPPSAAGPDEIRLRNLHRSSRLNRSRSQENSYYIAEPGIPLGNEHLNGEQSDPANGGGYTTQEHQMPIAFWNNKTDGDVESISVRSEYTFLQRRDLGMLDVAALIINKQVGTGIFTTPGLVLSLTGSKTTSIIMWFCGGIWAFLSVIIYVEFGSAFPFNGGELIYLDEVFRKPELLATVLFSAFFIMIPNTDGNSIQFAKHVLLAANPKVTDTEELDKRLISFVAISVLTVVCFIHYFSRNSGLFLNLVFAAYKVLLVIVFIICGCIASDQPDNGKSDWGSHKVKGKNVLAAMIYIIYSYQGWENANYVGGELKVKSEALKKGAFLAVGVVTLLYTLVTMAYSIACPFGELSGQDLGVVTNFAPKAFGHSGTLGIKICIALSAFGNLIAVVYTSSKGKKVKQQIARQCVIPFYKFFAKEDKQFMTPSGALILHWATSVVWIVCTPNSSDGYGFIISLFIYGQLVVGVFVCLAFFDIRRNYEADNTRNTAFTDAPVVWHPVILTKKPLRILCALVFIGMNMMVLIQAARSGGSPPAWLRPVVVFVLLFLATVYWAVLRIIETKSNSKSLLDIRIVKDGMEVEVEADKPLLQKAKMEGNSRIVVYEVHGKLQGLMTFFDIGLHKVVKVIAR